MENIFCFISVFKINDKLLVGRKPPDDINVRDRLNELNDLMWDKFNII